LLGAYLDRKGQSQQALDEYEAALRVNPNLRDVKLQAGILYVKLGRTPEALRIARELEQVAPKSSAPLLLKGVALLAQSNAQGPSKPSTRSSRSSPTFWMPTGDSARHISRPDRTIRRGELSARLGAERQGRGLAEQSGVDRG